MGEAKQNNSTNQNVIDFMGQRFVAMIFSVVLLVGSVISLAVNGLQFGLDFTGGLQIEAQFSKAPELEKVRDLLNDSGFKDAVVVNFGSDKDLKITTQQDRQELVKAQLVALIPELSPESVTTNSVLAKQDERLPDGGFIALLSGSVDSERIDQTLKNAGLTNYRLELKDASLSILSGDGVQILTEKLLVNLLETATDSKVTIKRTEFVGPQVGDELRDQGGIGLLFALAVVMAYVALRFQFKFSVGAVVALAHDVIIVLGVFSVLKLDFDLTVLAAVLAVIGYSLNDTIVVSDRIRENFRIIRKGSSIDVINESLTQTLGRTLVTSLTTLLVLLALFFVGGELIHSFSIALIVGIVIGTYSSIYVAANVLLLMDITKEDLIVPEKEGVEFDEMP